MTVAVGLSDHDELGVEDNVGSKVRVGVAVSVGSSDRVLLGLDVSVGERVADAVVELLRDSAALFD